MREKSSNLDDLEG